jgi:hypothetical protein
LAALIPVLLLEIRHLSCPIADQAVGCRSNRLVLLRCMGKR